MEGRENGVGSDWPEEGGVLGEGGLGSDSSTGVGAERGEFGELNDSVIGGRGLWAIPG